MTSYIPIEFTLYNMQNIEKKMNTYDEPKLCLQEVVYPT